MDTGGVRKALTTGDERGQETTSVGNERLWPREGASLAEPAASHAGRTASRRQRGSPAGRLSTSYMLLPSLRRRLRLRRLPFITTLRQIGPAGADPWGGALRDHPPGRLSTLLRGMPKGRTLPRRKKGPGGLPPATAMRARRGRARESARGPEQGAASATGMHLWSELETRARGGHRREPDRGTGRCI